MFVIHVPLVTAPVPFPVRRITKSNLREHCQPYVVETGSSSIVGIATTIFEYKLRSRTYFDGEGPFTAQK
jgi:hypothetical protein